MQRLEQVAQSGNMTAELAQIQEEMRRLSRQGVEQALRLADSVERAGKLDLKRGIAHLQCRAIEAENADKKERLEQLNRYRYHKCDFFILPFLNIYMRFLAEK
jgi:hypothetical protein